MSHSVGTKKISKRRTLCEASSYPSSAGQCKVCWLRAAEAVVIVKVNPLLLFPIRIESIVVLTFSLKALISLLICLMATLREDARDIAV